MSQPRKLYKVLRRGKPFTTLIPGLYTGNKTHKIFGRLDCKSGSHTFKKNQVFFANWVDAVDAKYTACRKCQPRPSDTYPEHTATKEEILAKLHIGLWKIPPAPGKPLGIWYVRLNWQDKSSKKGEYRRAQIGYSEIRTDARAIAIKAGIDYNLPVIDHEKETELIWTPKMRTDDIAFARDKKKIKELLDRRNIRCFRWMFFEHFID